jgi:guanine nucleotide-binding protein subunit beta-2-like 1 protein
MSKITASIEFAGFLKGHEDHVTSIIAGYANSSDDEDAILVSGSRDKNLIIWRLQKPEDDQVGVPLKCLTGHSHFVTDLTISNDNTFVISSSWDKTMRLWDLRSGRCVRQFIGHDKEVLTTAFSADNRQIFSGGADKQMNLWNTLAECKMTSKQNNNQNDHKDWVSKVRFSQSAKTSYYASVGWDGRLKIWNGIFKLHASIKAHDSFINALAIARNGMYIATGGKDQIVKIWDYCDLKQPWTEYKCDGIINSLAWNSRHQWLAAATENGVKIWDISTDAQTCLGSISTHTDDKKIGCTSVCWSANGKRIYVGCTDGNVRVYDVAYKMLN